MDKILIYSPEEGFREAIKLILADDHELILTDSLEQANDVIKNAKIKLVLADKDNAETFQTQNPTVRVFPIKKPIKSDELLKACK